MNIHNRNIRPKTGNRTKTVQYFELQEKYQNLANAIILRAVDDYRLTNNKENLRKLERFFRSDRFAVLTTLDPEYLINELRKEKQ